MMFEIYLGFAEPGDHYLGRLLTGLDPNKASFAAIPPHFTCGMENEAVKEAMELCFTGIIDQLSNPFVEGEEVVDTSAPPISSRAARSKQRERNATVSSLRSNTKALLLRCLASMVHHADALIGVIKEKDGAHPFAMIPILNRPALLARLKGLVTTEASERIRIATGIPPHVEAVRKLDELVELFKLEREERKNTFNDIKNVIGEKIEEIALEHGQITKPTVEKLFEEFGKKFETQVTKKIDDVLRSVVAQNPIPHGGTVEVSGGGSSGNAEDNTNDEMSYPLYNYDSKFMQVPKDFELPTKCKRKKAWELWICGMTTHCGERIRPFRYFKLSMLPKKVATKLKTEWQPILRKMEAGLTHTLPSNGDLIDSVIIEATFTTTTNHLKANVCSFLWGRKRNVIENWSVASWSCYTQRAYILKNGNESDIANLPVANRFNAPHKQKRTLKRKRNDGNGSTGTTNATRVNRIRVNVQVQADDVVAVPPLVTTRPPLPTIEEILRSDTEEEIDDDATISDAESEMLVRAAV